MKPYTKRKLKFTHRKKRKAFSSRFWSERKDLHVQKKSI